MIDRLESDGLVQRSPEKQGRNVPIALTGYGRSAYRSLRTCQSDILEVLLSGFSQKERRDLEHLLERLLSKLTTFKAARDHICRFCDEGICEQSTCPVETTYLQTVAQE